MKKLISVFAALALVGSLAAQKGKKPAAKAPAKPAVAAPAVPAAVSTVAAIAPAKSGPGIGLFIEGRGTYTQGHGSASTVPNGAVSATSVPYATSAAGGFGGGGTIGYNLTKGLAIVGSFDYRGVKSRKWEITSAALTGTATRQVTKTTMVLGFGFRPSIEALGGTFYAGAGFAYVLPYTVQTDFTDSSAGANLVSNVGGTTGVASRTDKELWNAGMGAYGEFGYNYHITENLYVGLGVRLLVTTATNIGKTNERTSDGVAATGLKENVETVTATTQQAFATDGNTDLTGSFTVGVRF